jgi:hypothetical protein
VGAPGVEAQDLKLGLPLALAPPRSAPAETAGAVAALEALPARCATTTGPRAPAGGGGWLASGAFSWMVAAAESRAPFASASFLPFPQPNAPTAVPQDDVTL